MRLDLANLPSDTVLLQRLVCDLVADNERRDGEIEKLRLIIRQLQRGQFGRRSERLDPDQLRFGLEELDADIGRVEAKQPALPADEAGSEEKPPRPMFAEHLPREDVTLALDTGACPDCGGALHPIGVTTSEMLDWIPASVRVIRIHRPKHGCRACGTIHQAAAPERLIAKGMATPGLIAQVLVSKYCDHTPLYRQAQILARHGVDLDRSTLANWVGGACWWLEPLQARLAANVFASTKIFADDTPIPVLDPGRGRTKTGRLWVYTRDDRSWDGPDPPAAVYFYSPDRKAERPAAHLGGFSGVLQVDGYAGFERLTATGSVVLAACWAHVRRKFYEFTRPPARRSPPRHYAGSPCSTPSRSDPWPIRRTTGACPRPGIPALRRGPEAVVRAGAWPYSAARHPGGGDPLCPRPLAGALSVPRRWPYRPRQQPGRTRLSVPSPRPQEPSLRRLRWRGRALGHGLLADRHGKAQNVEPFAYLRDVLERMAGGHPMAHLDQFLPWNWKPLGATN